MEWKNKRVVVLGLGGSGMAAATLLQDQGANVLVRDEQATPVLQGRAQELRVRGLTVELGGEIGGAMNFDLGVLSPGLDPVRPLVQNLRAAGVPLRGELEIAFQFCRTPVVAITGTNGKTTTTELIARALQAAGRRTVACGNIGKPFSEAVRDSASLDVMVVEVSSFQLEEIETFRPHVAVYLNFTPDHLDRYPDLEAYRRAKARIFENQTENDFAVLNARLENPPLRARRITFDAYGGAADYTLQNGQLRRRGGALAAMSEMALMGEHNAENILATLATAEALGLPLEPVLQALKSYQPQPHRCEKVAEIEGVLYINDSKGTNIDAVEKALRAMPRPVILIAGGKDKGLDFSPLRNVVKEKVRAVVLIGETRPRIQKAWTGLVPLHEAGTLPEAVETAGQLAKPGDIVLLSPGCSSFDMFSSYAQRGDIFRQSVLAKTGSATTRTN
jgi:UDP-N-acetylmuramoylalanine--D-glutamate ligase